MKKVRLFEQFTANENVNEAVAKNTKVYQIATPAPKAMLVEELEDLFGDDYRHIVTEFDDNEGYESVLVFNLTKSDIKRIQEEIGDVLIWEYSIKKGKAISESLTEAKLSVIHKAAKKGSYPVSIVVIRDGKVIAQELVKTPAEVPAAFNVIQSYHKHKGATVHIESKTGERLFSESLVSEAKGFKNTTDFEKFLIEIDGMGESQIRKIMGKDYIDTPGYYKDEKRHYDGVEDFMRSNMGDSEFEKLESWWENNVAESVVTESVFAFKTDNIEQLHFETDPKTAEEMKIELGKKQGEVSKRKQIESGEYSLRRFRKEIGYGNGKDVGVFLPGSYDASVSKLGDGPHKKAVKAVKWNQKKYDQWLEDMASNGGAENAFDMAQNAKNERGLIDWVKKNFRGDDPMQRIQWDIEAFI